MLTDLDYFAGGDTQLERKNSLLPAAIEELEPIWLNNHLGVDFAKTFDDNVAEEAGRWADLRDGKTYSDDRGITRRWAGFKNRNSPIVKYIYCVYSQRNQSFSTTDGEGKNKNNATADYRAKQARIWNDMVRLTGYIKAGQYTQGELYHYLLNARDENGARVYPEFDTEAVNPEYFINTFGI